MKFPSRLLHPILIKYKFIIIYSISPQPQFYDFAFSRVG